MPAGAQLKLQFLATGTWQHVFVNAAADEPHWVYKLPAAFGYILPFAHPARFKPAGLSAQLLFAAGARLPGGERLLAARLRRMCRRNFARMLALLAASAQRGLADIMLPCEVLPDVSAALEVAGATCTYRGPLLKQRRAEYLFERSENLRAFEWQEVVAAHHRLWRSGITFSTSTAVLELKNWALLEGRLRLFDTSSLTDDPRAVRRVLTEAELDGRERALLRKTQERHTGEPLVEFFRFIRRELNRDKLDQLWRADLNLRA